MLGYNREKETGKKKKIGKKDIEGEKLTVHLEFITLERSACQEGQKPDSAR